MVRSFAVFSLLLATSTCLAQGQLTGNIEIDGSSTVYPISEAAAVAFAKQASQVRVTVGVSGTGGGFKRFVQGQTDISDASRPIKPEEAEAVEEAGIKFLELPIAYDGLTFVVPKENTWLKYITVDEIKKIFKAPGAKTWAEVRDGWPAKEIKTFAPGTDSGTYDYFMEIVTEKKKNVNVRGDMSSSEDDNVLVKGVAGSPNGIGFFGVAYYQENKDKLNAIAVVNPETGKQVLPTREAIESGDYAPFGRPLFLYVNAKSFDRPEVKKFVAMYLKQGAEFAATTGYVPLPREMYDDGFQRCVQRKYGSHVK